MTLLDNVPWGAVVNFENYEITPLNDLNNAPWDAVANFQNR